MKTIMLSLLVIATLSLHAQQEKSAYKAIRVMLEKSYNNGDTDAIFSLFSADMKKALPIEQTRSFISDLTEQAGRILNMELYRYENTSYASYKTKFERALLAVNISLDKESKINGLFVKPFADLSAPELKRNSTPMQLPFKDEWTVIWGGDTREQNYHVDHLAQKMPSTW